VVVSAVAAEEVRVAELQSCRISGYMKSMEGLTFSRQLTGRGGFQQRDMGPPAQVLEMGTFVHACEGEMVVESTNPKVPHFNAPIYLENKVRLKLLRLGVLCSNATAVLTQLRMM